MTEDCGREEYRDSHASPDYGQHYKMTYETGFYHEQWERLEKPLLQTVLTEMHDAGHRSCLDFACGTGRITAVLEDIFPSVSGVDVSSTMLDVARQSCTRADFIERDITKDPLSESFDVVTAFRFFLNAQPELRAGALTGIYQSLNDKGRLVMNIHVNSSSVLGLVYRLRNKLKGRVVAKTCSFSEIEMYLHEAGFTIESTYWYSYLPRVGWRMAGVAKVLMLPVERFANWFPLVPRSSAQSFLIVARKR